MKISNIISSCFAKCSFKLSDHVNENPAPIELNYYSGSLTRLMNKDFDDLSIPELAVRAIVDNNKETKASKFLKELGIESWKVLNEMNNSLLLLKDTERVRLWGNFIDNHSKSIEIKMLLKDKLITLSGMFTLLISRPTVFSLFLQGIDDDSSIEGLRNKKWTENDMLESDEDDIKFLMQDDRIKATKKKPVYTIQESW